MYKKRKKYVKRFLHKKNVLLHLLIARRSFLETSRSLESMVDGSFSIMEVGTASSAWTTASQRLFLDEYLPSIQIHSMLSNRPQGFNGV